MPDPKVANPAEPATPPAKPAQEVPPAAVVKPAVTPAPGAKPGEPAPAVPGTQVTQVPLSALQEERDKRQSLQAELDALKRVAGQNVLFDINGNPVPQPREPQPRNDFAVELDRLWETDPRKAVQAELMAALTWYDNMNAAVDYQEETLAQKYPDFNNYRTEVRQYVRSLPPEQRVQKGIVELAYYTVRGQKVDNIINKTKTDMEADLARRIAAGEFAGGLPPGSTPAPVIPEGAVVLTQDQKNACMALGISEQDYINNMRVLK